MMHGPTNIKLLVKLLFLVTIRKQMVLIQLRKVGLEEGVL